MSYGVLYISLLISITCYCVDIFTAVNLLGELNIIGNAVVMADKIQQEISGLESSSPQYHLAYRDGSLQAV